MAHAQDDWDRHWDDYAESAERNPAQLYRRRLVLGRLGARPEHLVDIGSGQGDLVAAAVARFPWAEVLGVEGSQSGVRVAQAKVPEAKFVQQDLLQPGQPPAEYQGWATHAVCSEVLEHLDEPVRLLRNSQSYLRPGCRVVVTVPGGPMSAFDRHIGHRRHYRRSELRQLLETAGLEVEDVAAAGFPFFNLYRLVVILRGDKLISELSEEGNAGNSPLARVMMRAFRILFRVNLPRSPWGWQLAATARWPVGTGDGVGSSTAIQ